MVQTIKRSQKEINLGKNIARAYHTKVLKGGKGRRSSFFAIKNSLSFPDLCQAADFVDKNVPENSKLLLFGNSLPKSYKELGKCEFSNTTDSLVKEINWLLLSVRKYSYQVNLFIAYKEIFESSFLLGRYDEANRYLTKIEEEICYSMWTLESRFLLNEYDGTTSDNKDLLSHFNEENESVGCVKSLAHYLSVRAEKSLSVNRFNTDLEIALAKMDTDKKNEHYNYYLFKLSYLNHLKFSHYKEIIAYDFPLSIVDKYLNLRKILINLLTSAGQISEKKDEQDSIRQYVINRTNYLLKKINDPLLYKLKLFSGEKIFATFSDNEGIEQISIIDKYTTGLYQEVENDLKELLLVKPLQFDLYSLYLNSLVYQKKIFSPIGDPKSLQNQILSNMFRIVSVRENPHEAGNFLMKVANNLSSFIISYGIIDFVSFQTKGKKERQLIARLSYNLGNPIIYEVYGDSQLQLKYLELLKAKFPFSITVDFFINKVVNPDDFLQFEKKLPEVKYKTEYAKSLQANGRFSDASIIWQFLIDKYYETTPVLETALKNQFICFEKLGRFDDCIKLFVDNFLINHFIIEKIEVKSILQKISANRFKVVSPSIELPIFYTIANADENETHSAFEKFNLNNGASKPSKLLTEFATFPRDKMIFYLKFTCGPEILKHSIHIRGSKERLEERLSICQFLREKDIDDKAFYDDEIKYISNILVIQKGLMELDESKIYVNEQGIIAHELKEYEAIYQRYKAIAKIAEKSNLWMLDKKGRLTTLNYIDEAVEVSKVEYSSNPVYDIYKEAFDAIKEKFLYSKFGIVAYLSTRIRHGVLLGELRPIFEKHKLITLREGETINYRHNYYWDSIYCWTTEGDRARMQVLLKEFSFSIDGLIFDLIKKYLQVFNEDANPDGWFNFNFTDDELFWFSIKSLKTKDFSHFAQDVFEILWERTDKSLTLIRNKIQNEISIQFNELFDKLEKDIFELLGDYGNESLIGAIKACSTETQSVISRISRWFKRSGTAASDFEFNNLIDIVMEYTNKTHPYKKIHLERDVQFDCKIKGEYLTHFADLLRIFMENILKHSDDKVTVIPAKIVIKRLDNNELGISIQNEITNENSLHALRNVWRGQMIDVVKLSSEGKSGYHKAFKIIKSDLKNEKNDLATQIIDDEKKFNVSMFISLTELVA